MKPMRKLSHGVFSTRISSWIMNLFVATAWEAAKRFDAQAKLGQDFSPVTAAREVLAAWTEV